MAAHSGQSSVWVLVAGVVLALPSASLLMILMAPEPEQMSCRDCGFTMGDAMATPMDNANHTSTRRAMKWALRSVCMVEIIAASARPASEL